MNVMVSALAFQFHPFTYHVYRLILAWCPKRIVLVCNCENIGGCFQQGECPSRGLLRALWNLAKVHWQLYICSTKQWQSSSPTFSRYGNDWQLPRPSLPPLNSQQCLKYFSWIVKYFSLGKINANNVESTNNSLCNMHINLQFLCCVQILKWNISSKECIWFLKMLQPYILQTFLWII